VPHLTWIFNKLSIPHCSSRIDPPSNAGRNSQFINSNHCEEREISSFSSIRPILAIVKESGIQPIPNA
jgi:hypothetical protein